MNALTLQWHDAGQNKSQQIYEQELSKNKNPGSIRIGRDPLRCDIVLTNPTVSGLHIEIFFDSQQQNFYIRNLRSQNPPVINGEQLIQGEKPLKQGSIIFLGQAKLEVTAVNINAIAATLIVTPPKHHPRPVTPPTPPQPPVQPVQPVHHHHPVTPQETYGLECPKCRRISPQENLQVGCPWCGTSLAAAVSVLVAPNSRRE